MTEANHETGFRQQNSTSTDLASTDLAGAGGPGGLAWSWELDLEALLAAVRDPAPWERGVGTSGQPVTASPAPAATDPADPTLADAADSTSGTAAHDDASPTEPAAAAVVDDASVDQVEAEFAEYLEAVEAGRSQVVPLTAVAGRAVESVPAGAGLAGWLDSGAIAGLQDGALVGVATSYRRLASWAQAGELAAVAELAARSAAANDRIGVDGQGRPDRVPDDTCAEVSLALAMSQSAASWWTDLAVTLRWRLAATGAKLRDGTIDLARARAIAEATAVLDDEKAQAVQHRVLPRAGAQTIAQLRASLRRAVIAADPEGAERRREEAERRAKVTLYPDPDGTASLAGYNLPGIRATAAMARITALARALKASGAGGGIDLLRGHVFLGLLLGTLPYIPPPADGPPDPEPPENDLPDDEPPPGDQPTRDRPSGDQPSGDQPSGDQPSGDQPPGDQPPGDQPSGDTRPTGDDESTVSVGPPSDNSPADQPWGDNAPGDSPADDLRQGGPVARSGFEARSLGSRSDFVWRDETDLGERDDGEFGARPPPAWPEVPPFLPAGPAAMGRLRPACGGLLDLRVPWDTLTGQSPDPGFLGRLGPITPAQARHLTDLAAQDPSVCWRVIVTDPEGRAVAVTRLTRSHRAGAERAGAANLAGLVGQVTVIIGRDPLANPAEATGLPPVLSRVLAAARLADAEAAKRAAADAATNGGCAHIEATTAYRPTKRLWDYVTGRDVTCRFLTCRQPATRGDLDHTTPFDQGGRTCSCNLGGVCRLHHQIKQHPGWCLRQIAPGTFAWTTPAGRAYLVEPDSHAA